MEGRGRWGEIGGATNLAHGGPKETAHGEERFGLDDTVVSQRS
jgi:hypothetical protein